MLPLPSQDFDLEFDFELSRILLIPDIPDNRQKHCSTVVTVQTH